MLRRLRHLVRKELIQMLRDRATFRILVIMPVLQLLIYGYVAILDIKMVPMVLCDMDHSQESRQLAEQFTNSGYFKIVGMVDSVNQIDPYLNRGNAAIAVMLPYDFAKRLKSGKTATVQMIVDGTNSNTATIAMSYATNILSEAGMNILVDRLRRLGTRVEPLLIENQPRVWYNPDLKSLNYMVPGVICILLMQMLVPMTSGNIVREKERGTIEQLRVTPLRAGEMILGKTIPGVIIGYFNIFVILIVGTLWFGVPLRGNVFTLLFTSGIFIISSLALGVVISTFTQTQEQAMFVTQFFMIPNMFLSGFMFPINSMPSLMQYCTYVIPLRYFLVIVRGIFLKGVGLAILWPETLALAIFSVLMLALSVYRFGKTK